MSFHHLEREDELEMVCLTVHSQKMKVLQVLTWALLKSVLDVDVIFLHARAEIALFPRFLCSVFKVYCRLILNKIKCCCCEDAMWFN